MTFLNNLFDRVKDIADSVLSKPLSLPLTLDEGLLNKLIDKHVVEAGGSIQSLSLSFYEGGFKARGRAVKLGATVSVEADFALSKLEVNNSAVPSSVASGVPQMNKALQQELQVFMNSRSPLDKRRS